MRLVGVAVLAALSSACTSVKMVQRDGCWIKRTEQPFGRVREEIGPCMRAPPKWVDDQLTRLVQECVAQADHRWQVRAVEAWSRSRSYPAQPAHEEILRTCMQEARVGLVAENEELKRRVEELATERGALRKGTDEDRAHLRSSHERLAEWLGQAAQKPAGTATATASATSDGKATNESGATLASDSSSGSGATAPAAPAMPAVPAVIPASPPPAPSATPAPPPAPTDAAAPPAEPSPPVAPAAPAAPSLRSASAKPALGTASRRAARARPAKAPDASASACQLPCAKREGEPEPASD